MFRPVADGSGTRDACRDTVTPCHSAEAGECGVTTAFVLSTIDDEVKVGGIILLIHVVAAVVISNLRN